MSLSFRIALSSMLTLSLTALPLLAALPAPESENAWESAATFRSNDAYVQFTRDLAKKKGDQREVTLGIADALIGVQPKTSGNIDQAAELCQQLIKENPDDNAGLLATYLLARIEEFHRQPTNPQKAEEIYRGLLQRHPESFIAQLSVSKLAVLMLFNPESTREQQLKSLAELDTMLPKLTNERARCDTLFAMGNACILLKLSDEKALNYLIAAEATQIPSAKLRADTLVQIGTTAQRLNRKEVALKYYAKFVAQYQRDSRNYLVRQKMAELKPGS